MQSFRDVLFVVNVGCMLIKRWKQIYWLIFKQTPSTRNTWPLTKTGTSSLRNFGRLLVCVYVCMCVCLYGVCLQAEVESQYIVDYSDEHCPIAQDVVNRQKLLRKRSKKVRTRVITKLVNLLSGIFIYWLTVFFS